MSSFEDRDPMSAKAHEEVQPAGVSRRSFLQGAATVLVLSLANLGARAANSERGARGMARGAPAYASWADVYRERWTWDRIAKSTHFVNCAQQRGCAWNVFVKDGVVWREEQVASYPQTNAEVPDFNPRGCQKGACYSDRMYDGARLRHPLKRVGGRGEGRWKRVSWEAALGDLADATIDALVRDGPGSIVWDVGTGFTNGCSGLGITRTVTLLDTPLIEPNTEIGDHFPGATVTTGKVCFHGSFDDLFYSDLILIWGGNPAYTHIPNIHFIHEARYNGTRVVCITPDFNASCMHADEWIPVNVGSDAALGLALAHVLVAEDLVDVRFVTEQTDLPLLVRSDTRRFLRQRDLEEGGAEDVLYVFDRRSREIREAPRRSLALFDLDPALEGEYRVRAAEGEVRVTPVFALLRERLAAYTPEAAARVTGIHPDRIRRLARSLARAKAAATITQTNFSKFYHGMEMERAQILAFALAGQIGKRGAGIAALTFLSISGADGLAAARGSLPPKLGLAAAVLEMVPEMARLKWKGHSTEMILAELGRREFRKGLFLSSPLYLYEHAGLAELYGSARKWDPSLPRDFPEYLREAREKGWLQVSETPPRVVFEVGGNLLRRVRGYDRMIDRLLPRLDLLVTVDWRMSNTARHSDYVLPAAGWYEKDDITWAAPIAPFCHPTTRVVEPLGESRTDWEFHCLFLKALQQRAGERGIAEFTDRSGEKRRLDRVYEEFTFGRRFTEDDTEKLLEEILEITTNLGDVGWQELKRRGWARYTGVGTSLSQIGHATDFEPNQTITANTWQTRKKQPWPTFTRRMQFYIDHDLFFELGEELPVHLDNPKLGGDHPLQLTGGHDRWSIHSSWRDHATLLDLQRGEPVIHLNQADARARRIRDGDRVRVYNDVGSFESLAKPAPSVRPGQVIVYHAWEPFQFRRGKSHQSLTPSPMNPVHLAGDYFQLDPTILMGQPGSPDRGTRVEVERIAAGVRARRPLQREGTKA
jgi:DMSO reductase family type II enzyme molybdopterin subunit